MRRDAKAAMITQDEALTEIVSLMQEWHYNNYREVGKILRLAGYDVPRH